MIRFKRLPPRSLFGRSLTVVLTPMIVLQIVLAIVFYERHWENVTRHLADAVAGDVSTLIWMTSAYSALDEDGHVFRLGRVHLGVEARFRDGARLPDPPPDPGAGRAERLLAAALDQRVGRAHAIDPAGADDATLVSVELNDGVLDVFVPKRRLESRTTDIFIFWMIGTSAVLALVAAYFVRQQIRPIRRLATAADRFGKGVADPDFKPSGALEVRQAAQAFLSMRERIQSHIEQRTLMLAGVSHDLRTPLTRMKLELALLADGDEVRSLRVDVEDMERTIGVYLAFASGEGEERERTVDLGALVRAAASDAADGVEVAASGDLALTGRPHALRRCLANLIDNARRYGGTVIVTARRSPETVTVTVDDDGPGIPEEKREEALRPFVRLDASRNPNRGGGGLGLAIARDVARGHGGDLALAESPSGGLRARLVLPVRGPAP